MKNNLTKLLSIFIIIIAIFSLNIVYAEDIYSINAEQIEYSEEYKKWLSLDEEERKNTVEPRKYDIATNRDNTTYLKNMTNVFKAGNLLRASIPTTYNLNDIIPENVVIRDQMQTNSCWAFATLGVLESSLGLRDKLSSKNIISYDFSERHMNYASTKSAFLNGKTNKYGFSRELSAGGNFWMASAYLTNGMGAVDESSLPFEDNEDKIDISEIEGKEVTTTLYDTREFESVTADEKEKVTDAMKEHIMNYGGIYVNIHGAAINGDSYNNETGAIYCKDKEKESIDHAVVVIGWDDNYPKENFNEKQRPQENGAWIVKNSWGDKTVYTLQEAKEKLFNDDRDGCEGQGWYSPEQIPDNAVQSSFAAVWGKDKVKIEGNNLVVEMGNNGYMYMSYEDCNIYTNMAGIEKATNSKDYLNVYQNDYLGAAGTNMGITNKVKISLANVFKRDSSIEEAVDKVSIFSYQDGCEYKVYINPNNDSKAKKDLIEVKLKEGDTVTLDAGYHVIELAEPLKLTGDSFVVVLEIQNVNETKQIALESRKDGTAWAEAEVNAGESFMATEAGFIDNVWTDLATWEDEGAIQGNLCIKAYTNKLEEVPVELSEIYIENAPTKTAYKEGENFDKTGMKVVAKYSDGSSKEITNYDILNGENLQEGTTSITISYTENGINKTTTQEITVNKEQVTLTEIYVENGPSKTQYEEGENFDKTGMKVIAKYSDNSSKEITDYQIIGGDNLKAGTTSITIKYEENGISKETTVNITVNAKQVILEEIYIEQSPTKTIYKEGENFDKTGMKIIAKYNNGSSKEITDYQIIGGENLQEGTTSVTIRYEENGVTKETTQNITVSKEVIEQVTLAEIYVENGPNKTQYEEGENFDKTGMKVLAKYSDGSSKEITDYQIIGGENLQEGTTSITIRYEENGVIKSTNQEIIVNKKEPKPEPEKEPVSSNFNNAKTTISKSKLYFDSKDLSKANGEITIKITGIKIGDKSNKYEYYYYLSGTQGDGNIDNWKETEMIEEDDGTYSMEINIKSEELENYEELLESNNLYLYIKEIASIEDKTKENIVTLDVENNSEPECYIDGEYVGGIEDVLNYNKNDGNNNNNNDNNNKDESKAPGFLPYAGKTILIIVSILIVTLSGAFAYHRYKNIDR